MKEQRGITLVALVVTIVVLIILAGISINLILGDNGIITVAKKAKENTELAKIEEETELNELYMQIEKGPSSENASLDVLVKNQKEYIDYLNKTVYPEGMPLVPKMTNSECAIGKVVGTSTRIENERLPYKAFDKIYYFGDIVKYYDLENSWQTKDNGEAYIQFEFYKPVIVSKVEFIPSYTSKYGGVALKNAKLLLSNDGENFIDASELISYENDINTSLVWNKIESNDKTNSYKYVRLYVNGSNTSSYGTGICIREMQIYGWFKEL